MTVHGHQFSLRGRSLRTAPNCLTEILGCLRQLSTMTNLTDYACSQQGGIFLGNLGSNAVFILRYTAIWGKMLKKSLAGSHKVNLLSHPGYQAVTQPVTIMVKYCLTFDI